MKCRLRERHLNGHLRPACEIGKDRLQRRIRLHQLRCCTSSLHSSTTTFTTKPVQEEGPIFLHARCRQPTMTSLEFGLSRTSAASLTYKLSYRHDWRTTAQAAPLAMEGFAMRRLRQGCCLESQVSLLTSVARPARAIRVARLQAESQRRSVKSESL